MQTFKRVKNHELIVTDFYFIARGWYIKMGLDIEPSPPNHGKSFLKILATTLFFCWLSFMTKWYTIQKIRSKMYSTSCVNTHHDATTFEVAGMGWNRKNWISQKQYKIFK